MVSTGLILENIFIITAISIQGNIGWSYKRSSMHLDLMNSQEARGIEKGMQNNGATFVTIEVVVNKLNLTLKRWGRGNVLKISSYPYPVLPNLNLGNKIFFKRHVVPLIIQSA